MKLMTGVEEEEALNREIRREHERSSGVYVHVRDAKLNGDIHCM